MGPSSPFSSSSSSSATATATTTRSPSVNGKACNSKNGSPECLPGVLRLLLCLNGLPSHPGDHFKEEEKQPLVSDKLLFVEEANYPDDFNTPGVVARLMGLESRPHITEKSPSSIRRSQSIQGSRRHVKSFREISSYKELEDASFFIISFDNNAGEIWQGTKSDMNSGEKKQRKKAISKNNSRKIVQEESKENQDANNLTDSEKIYSNCEVRDPCNVLENSCQKLHLVYELVESGHKGRGRRIRRKRSKSKLTKLVMGCNSKDSSPNSVLDFAQVPPEPDPDSPSSGLIRDDYDRREKWDEMETSPLQSKWIFKEILEESKDIGRYLGRQILDRLLAELLSNLEIPMKSFDLPS